MNLWQNIRRSCLCLQNKFGQLWENRCNVRGIANHVIPPAIITVLIIVLIKRIIAFIRFLHTHYIIVGLLLWAWIELRTGKNVQKENLKANSIGHKKAKMFHYTQRKILLSRIYSETHKLDILKSKASSMILLIASIFKIELSKETYITLLVNRALFDPTRGNPLHLREGQYLPTIRCKKYGSGQEMFALKISTEGFTPEEIKALAPIISSSLIGNVENYAVTKARENMSKNHIIFLVEDMSIDHRIIFPSVESMITQSITKLLVDERTTIDLTTSGSVVCAGKTRSGKTTGIIALLLQVVPHGPDRYGSECVIVDPKRAELSRLPNTVTIDEDGGGRAILAAIKRFADSITKRQNILNGLSEVDGNAVHWWEAGMYPSFLFLDEFVSLRTLFPKRAEKEDPEYCLAAFDALLKRIVTMGASAGCYVIISIAEASVEEGGLPAMLRSAMSTRILFRPTMPEARLLWSADKLENLPDRTYQPGDAWFSSTDGKHDEVSFVRFPQMDFPIYKELGRYLRAYYTGNGASGGAER